VTTPPAVVVWAPLACAACYSVGALALKGASERGLGPWRITFASNVTMGILFAPLLLLGGAFLPGWHPVQPAVTGLLFFGGQICTFLALDRGDASVATPVLGSKVLFVTLFTAMSGAQVIPPTWWAGAALCTLALALLGSGPRRHRDRTLPAAGYAMAAAGFFALTDVLVQRWVPLWGAGRFVPAMFGCVALLSPALIPRFRKPLRAVGPGAVPWLALGCILIAAQALGMALTLGTHGHAPLVNILYSTRGVWTIVLVVLAGGWLGNNERHLGRRILAIRTAGALLLLVAVAVALR
jgi:drug/metabolite transporter (DMT)-like permease